jgi:hypothetical protein
MELFAENDCPVIAMHSSLSNRFESVVSLYNIIPHLLTNIYNFFQSHLPNGGHARSISIIYFIYLSSGYCAERVSVIAESSHA